MLTVGDGHELVLLLAESLDEVLLAGTVRIWIILEEHHNSLDNATDGGGEDLDLGAVGLEAVGEAGAEVAVVKDELGLLALGAGGRLVDPGVRAGEGFMNMIFESQFSVHGFSRLDDCNPPLHQQRWHV